MSEPREDGLASSDGAPPDAVTRQSDPLALKTMVPLSPQVAFVPTVADQSQTVRTDPPFSGTMRSFSSCWKPSESPLGEKNGDPPKRVPGTGTASSRSSERV